MKTTGVVRRIDDLGRIVIPKEIRRTLHIRDGESLEIFVENEMISLKKYSSMSDLSDIAINLVNTINKTLNKEIFISDRDKVIAVAGNLKNKYVDKNISKYLQEKMDNREVVTEKDKIKVRFIDDKDNKEDCFSYVISPIIMNGDAVGSVVIFSANDDIKDLDVKLALIISNFLGKHIEE